MGDAGSFPVIELTGLAIVAAAGLFLLSLGVTALAAPAAARRFLRGFARTPATHYAELGLRLVVGGAFVVSAPTAPDPGVFRFLGAVLIATTASLLIMPWHWHRRFAERAVPVALRFLPLLGVCAIALGSLLLITVFRGTAS